MSEPTLQANFSANTAGFSQGVSVLQQKLNELNTAMEQSKQEVAATNAQIRAYQQELQRLEKATQTSNAATEAQKQQMTALLDKLTGLRQGLRSLTETYEINRQEIKETKSDINSYEKELYKLNAATDNGKEATAEQSQRIDTLRGKIDIATSRIADLAAAQSELKGRISSTNAEIRQYERELIQLKSQTNNGAVATDEQKQRMQELRDKIAQTTSQLGTMRTAQQDLQSQIKNVNSELHDQNEELHDQNEELKNGANNAASFGDVLKASLCSAAVQQAVSKLASSLKSAAQYCYNVGSSFEAGMSQVSAISGATAAEMEQLTQRAKELGAATKFTASEAAEAMNYMAMAGWDAEQMLGGIDGVISLAAASGENLGQVSDIVTDALTAFGLAAEDAGHFSDVLAAASAASNTNVAMMGETFKYAAPLAGALGFSIEEVSEAVGLMANSGIKSSQAGTTLRTFFTALSDDVKITGDAIGEVTIKTSNADGTMRSLNEILTDMRAAFAQLSEAEQTAQAEAVAGKEAMSGLLALMNAGEADVEKLRAAIVDCDSAAQSMAETMQDNVSGAVTIMQSALEGLGIAVYEHFGENLKDFVADTTDIFASLTEQVENGELGDALDKLSASLGAAGEDLAALAGDVLPKIISGIANFLTVVVNLRAEIGAGVAAFATYKTAMLGLTLITKAAAAIKSFGATLKTMTGQTNLAKAALQGLTSAIAANPIGTAAVALSAVAGVVSLVTSHIDDCTQHAEELRDKAEELNQTAHESKSAADDVADLVEEYKHIKETADDTEEAKAKLKEIQDKLIDTYDLEADGIDLVNGKYEEQLGLLEQLSAEKGEAAKRDAYAAYTGYLEQEEAEAKAASEHWFTLGDYKSLFRDENGNSTDFEAAFKNLVDSSGNISLDTKSSWDAFFSGHNGASTALTITGNTAEKLAAYEALLNLFEGSNMGAAGGKTTALYNELYAEYTKYKAANDTNQQILDNYYYSGTTSTPKPKAAGDGYTTAPAESVTEADIKDTVPEDLYDEQQKLLKWRLDMGYITEAEYYAQLAALRDKYLDESSSKWRSATLDIHKYQVSQNGSALDEIKEQYNDAISAIDGEIKQHNRDREDEDIESKIAEVDKQLQYDRLDEYSRMQLEQKRQELLDEKEETEWQRQKSDEKEMLSTVYTMAKDAYDQGVADLNSALQVASAVFSAIGTGAQQTANTVSTVNNNSVSMIMNAVSQTSDQIAAAVIKALSSSI